MLSAKQTTEINVGSVQILLCNTTLVKLIHSTTQANKEGIKSKEQNDIKNGLCGTFIELVWRNSQTQMYPNQRRCVWDSSKWWGCIYMATASCPQTQTRYSYLHITYSCSKPEQDQFKWMDL